MIKLFISDVIDTHLYGTNSPPIPPEEDLQSDLSTEGLTFDKFERAVYNANQLHNPYVTSNEELSERSTEGTEPSSHELFEPEPEIPQPSRASAVSRDYKKRAVTF